MRVHFVIGVVSSMAWVSAQSACQRPASSEASATNAVASTAATTGSECAPQRALERLDTRTPVPLLPHMANHQRANMRDHLLAVQQILAGVAVADFAGVEAAARRLGSSEQMTRMCSHMGAGAEGFTERALDFHHTADAIAAAALRRDPAGVLSTLDATLQRCTACHASYRQHVVDAVSFSRLARGHGE